MRPAFTLVELMVAIGIAAVISSAVFGLLQSGLWGSHRLTERASAEQDARLTLQAMAQEMEEGTALFHPRPGEPARDGVGFVNARGEPIMYYFAKFGDAGAQGRTQLRRTCLTDNATEVLLDGVRHFRASVPPVAPGRFAAAVDLDLAVGTPIEGVEARVLTAVYLRALDRETP